MKNKDQALYELLLKNKDKYLTQEEVWEELNHDRWLWRDGSFHDSQERIALTKQINRLNRSYDFEGIIVSNSKGIKLATEKEAIKQLKSIYAMACKKLKYARDLEKKINRNGQFDIELKEYHSYIEENGNK